MSKIHKLWLIHREIGSCIFEQTFEPMPREINSDLIGGFLLAILSFSQEIADEDIEFIQMRHIRIIYHITSHLIFALAVSGDVDNEKIERALKKIEERFYSKYCEILENYNGQVGIFTDFAQDVEEILDRRSTALKFISEARQKVEEIYNENRNKLMAIYNNLLGDNRESGPVVQLIQEAKGRWERIQKLPDEIGSKIEKFISSSLEKVGQIQAQLQDSISKTISEHKSKKDEDSD